MKHKYNWFHKHNKTKPKEICTYLSVWALIISFYTYISGCCQCHSPWEIFGRMMKLPYGSDHTNYGLELPRKVIVQIFTCKRYKWPPANNNLSPSMPSDAYMRQLIERPKIHTKMLSTKWQLFCLRLNALKAKSVSNDLSRLLTIFAWSTGGVIAGHRPGNCPVNTERWIAGFIMTGE